MDIHHIKQYLTELSVGIVEADEYEQLHNLNIYQLLEDYPEIFKEYMVDAVFCQRIDDNYSHKFDVVDIIGNDFVKLLEVRMLRDKFTPIGTHYLTPIPFIKKHINTAFMAWNLLLLDAKYRLGHEFLDNLFEEFDYTIDDSCDDIMDMAYQILINVFSDNRFLEWPGFDKIHFPIDLLQKCYETIIVRAHVSDLTNPDGPHNKICDYHNVKQYANGDPNDPNSYQHYFFDESMRLLRHLTNQIEFLEQRIRDLKCRHVKGAM